MPATQHWTWQAGAEPIPGYRLLEPLGQRAVIDMDSDEELPLYTPKYLNNVVQPDHGYRLVGRRASRAITRASRPDKRGRDGRP